MSFDEITAGLKELLVRNSYNPNTIKFYEREWRKIRDFILEEYGDDVFDIERGLAYLEKTYYFKTKYDNGTISQQRVQLLRVVNMLEDYRLHQVLTRRYFVHSNPIKLTGGHAGIHNAYVLDLSGSELSRSTVEHYTSISKVFLDYLAQKKIHNSSEIKLDSCHGYLKTLAGLSFKTVEQNVCGLRHFLRYLQENGIIKDDLASELHMPVISKQAKIPSCWSEEELKKLLASIDRNSPIGKRDYAMILLACVLGIRIGDIKRLTFENFDWTNKKISFTQHKTHKPLSLPLPDAIGWAVIDYIKNGRPKLFETNVVFIKAYASVLSVF